ncbi:transcription factor IIIB 90 kDa subunit, partial [Phenoliferia sp. Uapishka_3]
MAHLRAVLIDLSGTIHVGDIPTPGASAAIRQLREAGIAIRFIGDDKKQDVGAVPEQLGLQRFLVQTGKYLPGDEEKTGASQPPQLGALKERWVRKRFLKLKKQRLDVARRRDTTPIQALAVALRLPDRLADAGQRYFNLAVNMNFTKGRRTQYVVAACLYSACRMEKTSHMLIDFSDLLEINVFVLGSTYLKLVKELSLQLPNVDPSLYISRFAALLEFGDETQKVAQDAVRLVARMGRDWMHIGRRPAGVCGACLLLAARMNNFRRSITEVVQVVKIADVTLRKRLGEFKDTPSGALTVSDFRTLWLDETADPPAFTENQKKEKKAREKAEERQRRKEEEGSDFEDSVMGSTVGDGEDTGREAFAELAGNPSSPPPPGQPSAKALGKRRRQEQDNEPEDVEPKSPGLEDNEDLARAIEAEFGETLESEAGKQLTTELDKKEMERRAVANSMTNLNSSDRLDDLDEDELDSFILTPTEAEAKSRLWMEFNKEYLQALADKQTGPDGELRPEAKRRVRKRHRPRDSSTAQGTDAADATKQMLTKKRFSKKINYAAINGLFGTSKEGEDDGIDAPILGKAPSGPGNTRGQRTGTPVARGTAIQIRMPTFAARAATPSSATRPAAEVVEAAAASAEPESEPEEEAPAHVEEVEEMEEAEEEEEEWRTMMGGANDDGMGMDYEEEI